MTFSGGGFADGLGEGGFGYSAGLAAASIAIGFASAGELMTGGMTG